MNQFQFLSRFVRDHRDHKGDLTLDEKTVRDLVTATEANLKVGIEVVATMRRLQGLPPHIATYEETYGEPDPNPVVIDGAKERSA